MKAYNRYDLILYDFILYSYKSEEFFYKDNHAFISPELARYDVAVADDYYRVDERSILEEIL